MWPLVRKILVLKGKVLLWAVGLTATIMMVAILAFQFVVSRPAMLYSLAEMAGVTLAIERFDATMRPFSGAVDFDIEGVQVAWEGHDVTIDRLEGDVNLWNVLLPDLAIGQRMTIEGLTVTMTEQEDVIAQNPLASPWLRFWEDTQVLSAKVVWQSTSPWMLDHLDMHLQKKKHWQADMSAKVHYPGWAEMPVTASAQITHTFGFHPEVSFEARAIPGQMTLLAQDYDFRFDLKGTWNAEALLGSLVVEAYDGAVSGPQAVSHVIGQVRSEDLVSWDVHVQQLQVGGKSVELPVWPQLTVSPQRGASIELSQVQLSHQGQWLAAMPDSIQHIWRQWQPELWLKQLSIHWSPDGRLETIRGGVDVLRWSANGVVPGLDLRQLTFDYLPTKGMLQIIPQGGSELHWQTANGQQHRVKAQPLVLNMNPLAPFDDWSLPAWQVEVGNTVLTLAIHSQHDQQDQLDIQLRSEQLSDVVSLLPMSSFSEPLRQWLSHAFVSGKKPRIEMHYQGEWTELLAGNMTPETFDLRGKVEDVTLKFDSAYPPLTHMDAGIVWQPNGLVIRAEEAQISGATVRQVRAEVLYLNDQKVALRVNGNYQATLPQAKSFLLHSPLAKDMGIESVLTDAQVSGQAIGQLSLWIPLDGYPADATVGVLGSAKIQAARVDYGALMVDKIATTLLFSDSRIEIPSLSGKWLDGDIKLRVSQTTPNLLRLNLQGQTTLDAKHIALGSVSWRADGQMAMSGDFKVKANIKHSDLQLLLPAPFTRAKGEMKPWSVQVEGNTHDVLLSATDAEWRLNSRLLKTEGLWGLQQVSVAPVTQRRLVSGESYLPQVELGRWLDWLSNISSSEAHIAMPAQGRLTVDRLLVVDQVFPDVVFDWTILDTGLRVAIRSEHLSGWWQQGSDKSRLHVDKLRWQRKVATAAEKLIEPLPNCRAPDAQVWPSMAIDVDQLQLETIRPEGMQMTLLSGIKGELSQEGKTRSLKGLTFKHQSLIAEGGWVWQADLNRSSMAWHIKAKKAEHAAALLGLASMVEGGDFQLNSMTSWSGGLDCYDTRLLQGDISMSAKSGVLTETSPGFARLFGLLSFDAFTRRLKLGLDDVVAKGLAYDDVSVKASLQKGFLKIDDMRLNGPSIRMSMNGNTDLIAEEHQLKAKVTPLIGDSIPTMALLSGASPITAIGVYLIQKIVPPLSGNILEFDYQITGSWQDPALNAQEQH